MFFTDWFVLEVRESFGEFAGMAAEVLCCLAITVITYLVCVHCLLAVRFLRIYFGKKVQADAAKAVILTGATSGFGLATTKRLYGKGFTVFACYYDDRKAGYKELLDLATRADHPANTNGQQNGKSTAIRQNRLFLIKMDVRVGKSIGEAAKEILKLLEAHELQLHCLINNAAVSTDGPFELITTEGVSNMLDTNIAGVYRLTKELVFRVIKDKGRVINVGSGMQYFPGQAFSLYGSSKAALAYFTESLNQDLKPYGAACYSIVPGNYIVHTNITLTRIPLLQDSLARLSDEEREVYKDKIEYYEKLLSGYTRERLARSKEDPSRLAELYGFTLSVEDCKAAAGDFKPSSSRRSSFVSFTDGSSSSDVDLTSVIDCYESAVTLRNPPRCIYAGNVFYQFLSGPILDYVPRIITNLLACYVIDNL